MSQHLHYIIDGYNYILRLFHIDFSHEHALWDAREKLIHQMIAYLGQKKLHITIVFDGQDIRGFAKKARPAGIKVRFSKAPQKADPLIINLVQKSKTPRNITVVTSDKSLADVCKSYGCSTLSVESFSNKLAAEHQRVELSKKYDVNMTSKEVEEWMQLFEKGDKN